MYVGLTNVFLRTEDDSTEVCVDDNKTGWGALLGDRCGGKDVTPIDAAGRMTEADAAGLPPAYIDVGELAIFRDEGLQYAMKLGRAGISCEFHLMPGV